MRPLVCLAALLLGSSAALSQQVDLSSGSVVKSVLRLHPGEYVWAPEIAPSGPMLLIVNVTTQRAVLFRNGVPIGASTVSTGRPGYRTPTGVFTILQKHVEHYSRTYDNAPMPFMQRLTWRGVALHAGQLPGYPASHGCIRLPLGFARLLYGATNLGMTVVITNQSTTPRVAPTPELALAPSGEAPRQAARMQWNPEKSPSGPVSIIVSVPDGAAVVLRNGVVIGSAPVKVQGPVVDTWAYALRSVDERGQHWMRFQLSSKAAALQEVPRGEWQRFSASDDFRRAVASIVQPGTTIVVTGDSLSAGTTGQELTVIEGDPAANQ